MANAGQDPHERIIPFIPKAQNWDQLEWEDLKVTSRVRKEIGTPLDYAIYVEKIIQISDDSDGLLKVVSSEILGDMKSLVKLVLNVDPDQIKKLTDPALYKLSLAVLVDPSKILAAALGPAAIPIPGVAPLVGQSLSRLLKAEVKGKVPIGIEFPHPIIWYPFVEAGDSEERFYLIDSNDPQGTFCPLELRKFNPDTAKFDRRVAERLSVKVSGNPDRILDADFMSEHIRDNGFSLRTKRVVIGTDKATGRDRREGGSVQPSRRAGVTPAAQNQGVDLPVWYKMYPATVSIEVRADADEKRKWLVEGKQESKWICGTTQLQGETVELQCPNLPKDFKGSIHWTITGGPSRMSEEGSGFVAKGVEQQSPLTDLLRDGKTCRGAVIQIVQDPLTEADPVVLAVPAPSEEQDLELVVKFEPDGEREYQGIKLAKNEFIGDGKDKIRVIVYARRKGREPEELVELDHVDVELSGREDGDDWITRLVSQEPTKWTWEILVENPMLYTANRKALSPSLRARAGAKSMGKVIQLEAPQEDLRPRLLHLKLWVVPGEEQGTAHAGAICCVAPQRADVLSGVPLRLGVVDLGGGAGLGLALMDAATQHTAKDGTAQWRLKYKRGSITWGNVRDARFRIRCGVEDAQRKVREATTFTIDVPRNVEQTLTALNAAAQGLDLTNPYFQGRGWLDWVGDWAFPDALRGPLWNISRLILFDSDNKYVCNGMRDRIFSWLEDRRNGRRGRSRTIDPDMMATMNGIEIAQYMVSPLHVFAGIHFSGSAPDDDPRFFDPWWRQEWGDVLTWRDQGIKVAAVVALIPVLAAALALMVQAAGAAAGLAGLTGVKAWLAGQITLGGAVKIGGAMAVAGESVAIGGYTFWFGADTKAYLDGKGHYKGGGGGWLKSVRRQWTTGQEGLPDVSPHEPWLEN